MGPWWTCDAAGPAAVLHRVSEAGWAVRRLGGGLPADVQQSERPVQARLAGDSAVVGSVGPLPLCPYHDAAVRRGKPAAAGHEESNERGRGASRLGEDRRGGWPAVAADASRLLRLAVAERAVGARHRYHDQAAVWPSGRRGGEL